MFINYQASMCSDHTAPEPIYEFAAIAMEWNVPLIDQALYMINYTDNAVDI